MESKTLVEIECRWDKACQQYDGHQYSEKTCPNCGQVYCYACCGGTNVDQGGKHEPDYMLCPNCGNDYYDEKIIKETTFNGGFYHKGKYYAPCQCMGATDYRVIIRNKVEILQSRNQLRDADGNILTFEWSEWSDC